MSKVHLTVTWDEVALAAADDRVLLALVESLAQQAAPVPPESRPEAQLLVLLAMRVLAQVPGWAEMEPARVAQIADSLSEIVQAAYGRGLRLSGAGEAEAERERA